MNKYFCNPVKSYNQYTYFIGPNPSTTFLPESIYPTIDCTTFIGPFSSIIGDVTIKPNVFVACNATIRADEGSPFYIGANSNIQDGVILHGLKKLYVTVNNKSYSIYIGNRVSCAHGSLVHGPCFVGDETFIGVNAVVFNARIGNNCYIGTSAIVTNNVIIAPHKFVPPGAIIDTQEKANALGPVPTSSEEFAKDIIAVNTEFPYSYSLLFGDIRCSCGLCCFKNQ